TKDERECYDIEDGKVIDKHGWLVIPKDEISLKKEVYETFHSAVAGHHAAANTQSKIQGAEITWSSIAQDLRNWIQHCPTCKKIEGTKKKVIPRFTGVEDEPFRTICVDSMGPFPAASDGSKHILCVVDKFTRWVELAAIELY
ncbi:hypothetical protein ADUPG1_004976, partial [Aduncisulcus paluster]